MRTCYKSGRKDSVLLCGAVIKMWVPQYFLHFLCLAAALKKIEKA